MHCPPAEKLRRGDIRIQLQIRHSGFSQYWVSGPTPSLHFVPLSPYLAAALGPLAFSSRSSRRGPLAYSSCSAKLGPII